MKVVAVTSCATGIAHTYMAAEAIMKVCKERGYKCKVEKQGALGLEDKLRDRDIKEADLIVFANDVGLTKAERFEPYKANFYKFAFVGLTLDWIKNDMRQDPAQLVEQLSTLIHGDVTKALEKCRIDKS